MTISVRFTLMVFINNLESIKTILNKLTVKFPDWLKIKDHSSLGTIVNINKLTDMRDIMRQVDAFEDEDLTIN